MATIRTTLCILMLAWTATAATFTVNSTADFPDSAAGNGTCSTGNTLPSGQPECTLRAAVQEANALAGADEIVVPAGTYNLSLAASCTYRDRGNSNPLTMISRTLCIVGETKITGAGATSTIIDGQTASRVFFISDGAVVTLSKLTAQNGKLFGADAHFDGGGGGINNQGVLTILDSAVSGNYSEAGGGGLFTSGSLTIRNSSISSNSAFANNAVGGGIFVRAGNLVIADSTLAGNGAGSLGGGIEVIAGTVSIGGSTFSNNTASAGGGMRLYGGTAYVTNSTFTGNTTTSAGGAIRIEPTGAVYLNNVTIARNTTNGQAGGGIYGTAYMRNSIVAANVSINSPSLSGGDCLAAAPGSIISQGYNLIQDPRNCNITGDTTGNIMGQDALLSALSFNGGSTQTIALLASSPAIDAGSPTIPGTGGSACPAFDQTGTARPRGARCDIGAFERNGVFALSKITPARGGNAGATLVVVSGSGFADGAAIQLRRGGQPDILGAPAAVERGGSSLSSSLDLTGFVPGPWDVVITNADATVVILPGAFTVQTPQAADLYYYLVGRRGIRAGTLAKFTIVYGNRGNVDALAVPLTVSTPGNFETHVYVPIEPPPAQTGQVATDWRLAPLAVLPYSPAAQLTAPFLIPIVPAGFVGTLDIGILLPATEAHGDTFSFQIALGNPMLNLSPNPDSLQRMVDGAVNYAQANFGVSIPPTLLPFIGAYTSTQLTLAAQAGRDQLVATLSSRPLLYSLAEMNIDAAQYATARFLSASTKAAKSVHTASATQVQRLEDSHPSRNDCKGQVMDENTNCDTRITPSGPADDPNLPPNPKGIKPSMCANIPNHHINLDKTFCIPDTGKPCFIPNPASIDLTCFPYPILKSLDPNEKAGPGRGPGLTAQASALALAYTISFENKATASGAAQQVVVTDQLDPTKVDLASFALGPMSFGSFTVVPPPGQTSYIKIVDLRPAQNVLVKVDANLNPATGLLTWHFATLDPLTGEITTDPVLGFLPPNTTPPNGEGHVVFAAQPKQPIITGTQVCNLASIVFDFNPAILTNQWCNTIDDVAPISHVQTLPAQSASPFTVKWMGTDTGSAIVDFDIYVSDNGAAFTRWLQQTSLSESTYTGLSGHSYSFFSVARDQAANVEAGKTTAEATTSVAGTCSTDVTAQYNIARGGYRLNNATGRYVQTITATTNSGGPAAQGLRFVLDALTTNVALANMSGFTSCSTPAASPFVAFPAPASPSPSIGGVLQFTNPGNVGIRYTLRLLAPDGQP